MRVLRGVTPASHDLRRLSGEAPRPGPVGHESSDPAAMAGDRAVERADRVSRSPRHPHAGEPIENGSRGLAVRHDPAVRLGEVPAREPIRLG